MMVLVAPGKFIVADSLRWILPFENHTKLKVIMMDLPRKFKWANSAAGVGSWERAKPIFFHLHADLSDPDTREQRAAGTRCGLWFFLFDEQQQW